MTDQKTGILIDDFPESFREIAGEIGFETAMKLVDLCGGESIYIPKADTVARAARDRAIRKGFDGSNYRELARGYGLSTATIRMIVDVGRKESN